jgi:hypothetical protein
VSHVTRELFFSFYLTIICNPPIELRIGIKLGDVIVEADDV